MKKYIKPQINVLEIRVRACILAGSGSVLSNLDGTNYVGNASENSVATADSRGNSDTWDDDEY
jgi:hypothetical protein